MNVMYTIRRGTTGQIVLNFNTEIEAFFVAVHLTSVVLGKPPSPPPFLGSPKAAL